MSIIVNNVTVRPEEVGKDYEAIFEELTTLGQKRLLREYTDKFFYDAIMSQYVEVRRFALDIMSQCQSETLESAIKKLIQDRISYDCTMVLKILGCPQFYPSEELKYMLASSYYWPVRLWVVNQKNNSNVFLQDMLMKELPSFFCYGDAAIVDAIFRHTNFKMDSLFKEKLKMYGEANYAKLMKRTENQ